jgi:hypothetical protein
VVASVLACSLRPLRQNSELLDNWQRLLFLLER